MIIIIIIIIIIKNNNNNNNKVTLNKTKYLVVERKVTDVSRKKFININLKGYDFLLQRINFTESNGH